jgi:general secretion pathway protein D
VAVSRRGFGIGLMLLLATAALAQVPQFPPIAPPLQPGQTPTPPLRQRPPQGAQPPAGQTPAGQPPAAAQPSPQQNPAAPSQQPARQLPLPSSPTVFGGLSLNNVSLTEVIDLLARQLKITYILDPRVRGSVILNTYGEIKDVDTRSLLDIILRLNGAAMVQQGSIYRIVPLTDVSHLPIPIETKTDAKDIIEDDQTMFNLIFLKYVTADELANVLKPFVGEGATLGTYPPANLLLILDSRRSMRRTMDLISMFDSDELANQRVHVFDVKNGRPTDIAKELENIEKSISLSEKNSPIKFLPIDRINTIIAVAPNPGAFVEVEKWLAKLDTPVKATAGEVTNYVYRVRFGDASSIACSVQALYGQLAGAGGAQNAIMMCMSMTMSMGMGGGMMPGFTGGLGASLPGMGGGMYGGGMYGGGMNGGGMYGGGMYGGGMNGASPYGAGYTGGMSGPGAVGGTFAPNAQQQQTQTGGVGASPMAASGADLTGTYLGNAPPGTSGRVHVPRVVANPFNNTLLIQATPQEHEGILSLLRDLDVPPRQVLIEAKIYSIDVTHEFSSDVQAALRLATGSTAHTLLGNFGGGTTNLSMASLVGKSREVATAVQLLESENRAKQLSAPAVIATDSIPAAVNVGSTVPTLAAEAVTGAQQGGTSLFANSVSNVATGTTLAITARVTPSGIVTMMVNQNVSAPQQTPPGATGIQAQTPSFSTQTVTTQITVQDGDTVAIGGAISESNNITMNGIPLLHRIPVLGALFGHRDYTQDRSELVIFLTPHVIYDSTQMTDATDEVRSRLKDLKKDVPQ